MPDSAQSSHPGAAQLAAIAQGKLAAAERAALQAHLTECPACRQALAALPAAAGEPVSSRDGLATMDEPPSGATAKQHPGGDIPADLANHSRYEVLQLLGQGGMGAVYKARHKKMDRFVALKVISAKLLDHPKAVERFQREVKAAAKLDHPNIVRAYDADEAGGTHFLVMEFVEGKDLAKYVAKKGPLPAAQACHFIRQAALGLEHAHQHGMVHRDIKPHNLMLASAVASAPGVATVKVMDFGLARLARDTASEAGLTGENALMGTADYIAPEQAQDAHTADIRADIYSLGCSLFHLLAGRPLLAGANFTQKLSAHLTGKLPLGELPASVPAELRTVLTKMVAKDPAQRYQTPIEVAAALVPFIKKAAGVKPSPVSASALPPGERTDQAIAAGPSAPARRLGQRERRRPLPLRIGGGILTAMLLTGAVVLWVSRVPRPTVEPHPRLTNGDTVNQPETLPATYKNSLGLEFVLVPRGAFLMGGGGGTAGTKEVMIENDFYLGKYEVTQGEWEAVTGLNPSHFQRAGVGRNEVVNTTNDELKRFPVEQVSWGDAQLFLERLNKREKEAGWLYRLPRAAEWEYACRGGPTANKFDYAFYFYFDKPSNLLLPEQANFALGPEKALKRTCKVGSYQPNRLGLYDMHGNVWEWCDDAEKGADGASLRVRLGGSWDGDPFYCRAACRDASPPSCRHFGLGLRLARVAVGKEPVTAPATIPTVEKKTETPPPAFKNSLGMEFVLVPKGRSWLGGGGGTPGDKEVEIAYDFYLGKYEVTQGIWGKVMGSRPSHFGRAGAGRDTLKDITDEELREFPVELVSWDDAQLFLAALNKGEKEPGWTYRLPKETEWEYACRGGPMSDRLDSTFNYYFERGTDQLLPNQANFYHCENPLKRTCKVGSYKPNRLGLYDMHGNVWEWCDDEEKDANGASLRVNRGGAWDGGAVDARAASRFPSRPPSIRFVILGVRVARVPVDSGGK